MRQQLWKHPSKINKWNGILLKKPIHRFIKYNPNLKIYRTKFLFVEYPVNVRINAIIPRMQLPCSVVYATVVATQTT